MDRLVSLGGLVLVGQTVDAPSESALPLLLALTLTFLFCMKQTMRQTKEGHAQALASLGDTGGMQVSDSVVCVCSLDPPPVESPSKYR